MATRIRGSEELEDLDEQNGYEDPYCYCLWLLHIAIAYCYCQLLLPTATAYCYCLLLLPIAIAHCDCLS